MKSAPRDVLAVGQIRKNFPGKIIMDVNLKHVTEDGSVTTLGPLANAKRMVSH